MLALGCRGGPHRPGDRRRHARTGSASPSRSQQAEGRGPLLPPRRDLRHGGRRRDNQRANVDGTRKAVELANEVGAKRFHQVSSIAVAGRYRGLFLENMFDEGQEFEDPTRAPSSSPRASCATRPKVPWRVYRPGIVVGHSETGEMDKIDGPYYFFKVIQQLRDLVPPWMPVVGLEGGKINIVPVDFVAEGDGSHRAPGRARRPGVPPDRSRTRSGRPGHQQVRARRPRARVRDADRPQMTTSCPSRCARWSCSCRR